MTEMMFDSERSDLDLAREIGDKFAEELFQREPVSLQDFEYVKRPSGSVAADFRRTRARRLLKDVLGVIDEEAFQPILSEQVTEEFVGDIDDAIRLMAFFRAVGMRGAVVFNAVSNAFDFFPVINVFNPRARRSLSERDDGIPPADSPAYLDLLINWTRHLSGRDRRVEVIDDHEAARGFVTLIAHSLRSATNAFKNSNTSYLTYTVHAKNKGYQVEYYPQYQYSPVVFGSKLTTPVSQQVKANYYHFQGWHNNQLVQDTGLYQAAPGSTSAHLRDF